MAEKKEKSNKPKIEIQTRKPEKRGIFDNIGNDRSSDPHPLREILNFSPELSDTQITNSGHSNIFLSDTQNSETLDTQNSETLDTQKVSNLDTQNLKTNALRKNKTGHSKIKSLSAPAPETKTDAPRNEAVSGAPAPKNKISGHSKNDEWRKYDEARSTVRVNLHIDKNIDKQVRQYCLIDANPKVELKEFYERAAVHLLNFLDTQKIGSLSAETPLDDRRLMMMFKCKPFIINLYLAYNSVFNEISGSQAKGKWSARWTPRDDEAAVRYNDIDPQIVELGIIQTQMNKGFGQSKIQTFKYYIDEIESWLTSGMSDEMVGSILQFHRKKWTTTTKREVDLSFLENAD